MAVSSSWDRARLAAWSIPALNLAVLLICFSLDIRDLYYKVFWLGPASSYAFTALGTSTFESLPLVPAANTTALSRGDEVMFKSGWPSFLATCDRVYPSGSFFLTLLGANCAVSSIAPNPIVIEKLVLAAGVRVDSMAWAACKLLYLHRRPPICQENVVTEFFHRYRLSDPLVAADAMAEPNSIAERELLSLLDLLSQSYPLSDVTCIEGFAVNGPGVYPASVFGCASANRFDAAFVGIHAPAFATLQGSLTWLTADVLNIMGFEFVVRQNARSVFTIVPSTEETEVIHLEHRTHINFSSFGHLYIAMILIDMVLLAAHTRSALETASVLLLPLLGTGNPEDVRHLIDEYSWSILYRSLYRSPPIVVLTLLSGLLSWQDQVANSIIWTWNEGSAGKLHAILSTVRVWMMVLCLLHALWRMVVWTSVQRAYAIARRTFLSTCDVLVIGVIVAIAEQARTFAVSSAKYALEGQRQWDTASFPGRIAYANALNEALDYELTTPPAVLRVLYAPMFVIIIESLVVAVAVLIVKMAYYRIRQSGSDTALIDGTEMTIHNYTLLPLEELLRAPIRAQSLVRNSFPLEVKRNHELYLPPSIYFDFGVIIDHDIIRTRRGFTNVIHLKVDVAKYFSPTAATTTQLASPHVQQHVPTPSTVVSPRRPSLGNAAMSPPSGPAAVLPTPGSFRGTSKLNDAVLATDGVVVRKETDPGANPEGVSSPRRPLAETAGSPMSQSMRRRKSTTELA